MTTELLGNGPTTPFEYSPPPTNGFLQDKAIQIAKKFGLNVHRKTESGADYKITDLVVPISSTLSDRTYDNVLAIRNYEFSSTKNPVELPEVTTFIKVLHETNSPKPYYYEIIPVPNPGKELLSGKAFSINNVIEFNPLPSFESNVAIVQVGRQRGRITPNQATQVNDLLDFIAEGAQAFNTIKTRQS